MTQKQGDDMGNLPARHVPDRAAELLLQRLEGMIPLLNRATGPGSETLLSRVGKFDVTRGFAVRTLSDDINAQDLSPGEKRACIDAVVRASRRMDNEKDDTLDPSYVIQRLVQLVREEGAN